MTLDSRTKSGGTTSCGGTTGIAPGATYKWRGSFFPGDPHTGVAWTASGLNAATFGIKIASRPRSGLPNSPGRHCSPGRRSSGLTASFARP